jgi:AcrR family transcriptional regulator
MALVVDKEQKRRDIACACKELLLEKGLRNISVSQIAQTAGIGKGTVYEYFENKEDIVFEIMTTFIAEYEARLAEAVSQKRTAEEKLFCFLYLGFSDEESRRQLALYREFLSIAMTGGTPEMIDFNIRNRKKFLEMLRAILQEGIANKEWPEAVMTLESALLLFALGLIVETHTAALDAKTEIERLIEGFDKLLPSKESL